MPGELFDDIARSDLSPARSGEGHYSFLNRSGTTYFGEVRRLLAEWLSRVPAEHKEPLVASLQSDHTQTFEAAFWELYLHQAYLGSGCGVIIHPDIPNSPNHPDFLVEGLRDPFYLEAVRVGMSPEDVGHDRRVDDLVTTLEKIPATGFIVSLSYLVVGPGALSGRRLGRALVQWLDALDPDEVANGLPEHDVVGHLPYFLWEADGWELEFHALPLRPEAADKNLSLVGIRVGEAAVVDNSIRIFKALSYKAKHYGKLDHPLVIAIMSNTNYPTKDYEVERALFGLSNRRPEAAAQDPHEYVLSEGHWLTNKGWRRGHAPQVIAVQGLLPWSVAEVRPRLWSTSEPDVVMPEQPGWLNRVDVSGPEAQLEDADSVAAHFGLPEDWLSGDPDFANKSNQNSV